MALSTLQKLLKNSPPPSRILASLHNHSFHSPDPALIPQPIPPVNEIIRIPLLGSSKADSFTHFDSLPFSSIHPFGLSTYPILSTGSIGDAEEEEDSGMWADSVKKKRKKKMNKHKYKKLRKRLRRKT